MTTVFADAPYWIAMMNPEDRSWGDAVAATRALGEVQFVTTQEVLAELLNFFAPYGRTVRLQVSTCIREILTSGNVTVLAQSPDSFLAGLDAYDDDDMQNLTDCISLSVIREEGIRDVLSTNQFFRQSGLRVLMGADGAKA